MEPSQLNWIAGYIWGIATYIWVLTNRKPKKRRGKVQLIDATGWFQPLRKNMGMKNCELADDDIQRICQTLLKFRETEHSKIFPNQAFGYWKVTVERPLRLAVDLSAEHRKPLRTLEEIRRAILAVEKETEGLLAEIVGSAR